MMAQFIHLVKLKAYMNTCVTERLEAQQQMKDVELTNANKMKRSKGQVIN